MILANFDVVAQNVTPDFPYTGTWYDLMDENGTASINITNTASPINLQPGEFRVYGNQATDALSVNEFENNSFTIFPNPAKTSFAIGTFVKEIVIYDITGKEVFSRELGSLEAGTTVITLEGIQNNLKNAGIYMVQFQAGIYSKTMSLAVKQ